MRRLPLSLPRLPQADAGTYSSPSSTSARARARPSSSPPPAGSLRAARRSTAEWCVPLPLLTASHRSNASLILVGNSRSRRAPSARGRPRRRAHRRRRTTLCASCSISAFCGSLTLSPSAAASWDRACAGQEGIDAALAGAGAPRASSLPLSRLCSASSRPLLLPLTHTTSRRSQGTLRRPCRVGPAASGFP